MNKTDRDKFHAVLLRAEALLESLVDCGQINDENSDYIRSVLNDYRKYADGKKDPQYAAAEQLELPFASAV